MNRSPCRQILEKLELTAEGTEEPLGKHWVSVVSSRCEIACGVLLQERPGREQGTQIGMGREQRQPVHTSTCGHTHRQPQKLRVMPSW